MLRDAKNIGIPFASFSLNYSGFAIAWYVRPAISAPECRSYYINPGIGPITRY
jgi:hypothetical protein